MKLTSLTLAAAILVSASPALAQRPRPHGIHGQPFVANKTFGLGLELGDIVALNGKWFLDGSHALDFGIGDTYADYYLAGYGGLMLYADYLWHPFELTRNDTFELPFYVGVGGRYIDTAYCPTVNGNVQCAQVFGIRIPLGLSFDFNNVPIDIFGQIVPTVDFFHDYTNHNFYIDFDITVGIRYWFT
jgi:hypothetical protein